MNARTDRDTPPVDLFISNDSSHGGTTIAVPPGKMIDLYIENPNGDTAIRATDRTDIRIRWLNNKLPNSIAIDESDMVTVQEDETRLSIKLTLASIFGGNDFGKSVLKFLEGGLKGANPFSSFSGNRNNFDLAIELPRAALVAEPGKVRLRTANGDVQIDGVVGLVDVATANGDVSAKNVQGEITLHAANGDLTLDQPSGRVTARSVSGDLSLSRGDLTRFTITTVNGDATIQTILTGDASRVETVSGDVALDLTVPASTGATLSTRSISGDAAVAPPFRSVAKRTWRIGPGSDDGPIISVKSVSGDLTARGTLSTDVTKSVDTGILNTSYASESPTAPVPPVPPTPTIPLTAPTVPPAPTGFTVPPVSPSAPTMPIPTSFRVNPISSQATDDVADAKAPSSTGAIGQTDPSAEPEDPRLAILRAVERGEIDIDDAMRRLESLK